MRDKIGINKKMHRGMNRGIKSDKNRDKYKHREIDVDTESNK